MICEHDWKKQKGICCEHEKCVKCGVIHKTRRCELHDLSAFDYNDFHYFWRKEICNFKNGIPLNKQFEEEHLQALKEMKINLKSLGKTVLEVGPGIGRLVPMFLKANFEYECVEISGWAAGYIENAYNVKVYNRGIEGFNPPKKYDLVACIHTLEHLDEADKIFEQLKDLAKAGGYIFLAIPDNSDLYNPDHWWFFDECVLRNWCQAAGLKEICILKKKGNERENFLYFLMQKEGEN